MKSRPASPTDPRWMPSVGRLLVIGAAIQILAVGAALVYLYRLPDPPATTRSLINEVLVPEEVVFWDAEQSMRPGRRLPPLDIRQAVAGTPEQFSQGSQLFAQHCASCHGTDGSGDGPAGLMLSPKPRDLTSLEGWSQGTRLTDLFRTLTAGLNGTAMPGFDYLGPDERFALAHHVRNLAPGHAADTEESLLALDQEFGLTEGSAEPGAIPVSMAMDKLVERTRTVNAISLSWDEAGSEAGLLLKQVTDAAKARELQYWLAADSVWRESPERLRVRALSGAPTNGFLARAALLSDEDWSILHAHLLAHSGVRP
jgi:mono/diheme cytochrome c family protein